MAENRSSSLNASIRRKLLVWFRREKRQLPWRGTRDPYRVWISEVMLQQTTFTAVAGRYDGFLRRFPDVPTLARAREDSVLAAWSGLGYYGRARSLRRAAIRILREHGGRIPRDPRKLEALPGFGAYTAAAVASIGYGARIPAADANVIRVLSRLFAVPGVGGSPANRRAVLVRAEALLPSRRPADLTIALMDLGQLICSPRLPSCPVCPLRQECAARRLGRPEAFPSGRPRKQSVRVHFAAAVAERAGRVLLVRRDSRWLNGLWEFPAGNGRSRAQARQRLSDRAVALGLRLLSTEPARASHAVVHRRLEIEVFRAAPGPERGRAAAAGEARWFRPGELSRAAIPTLTRKIARAAGVRMP